MSVRIHDLLEIDAECFLQGQSSAPGWVAESLREAPFVVVRRGPTEQGIPVGVRGARRNERWAGVCHPDIVRAIVTPQMLLSRVVPATRIAAIPALRSLPLLAERWRELDTPWGPGGSVGFELATCRHVTAPQSDLDIVIYADTPMTASAAQTLGDCARGLPAAVDIRVETPTCGFSLTEYASRSPAPILLRLASGTVLAADPWAAPNLTNAARTTGGMAANRPVCERAAPVTVGPK
jgi:phosphoribosyl-dephospho-CoA transferase